MVLLSKIKKILSHVTYLSQWLPGGGCESVSLFHFIDEKTMLEESKLPRFEW